MNPVTASQLSSLRISRRQLLKAGGIGALTMGLPGTVAASVDAERGLGGVAAEKSCIFVLLCGGPSHLDTWDLKPGAPDDIRGPYRPIASAVPGMRISELNTRLSTLTQHFTLIRSMTHVGNISNHFDAMHHLLSGQAGAAADSPYLGSIMSRVRTSERNIANYVWLIRCVGDPVFCAPNIGSGGHLGAQYMPLFVGQANNHPAMPTFRAPEELQPAVSSERLQDRRRMLSAVSTNPTRERGFATTRATRDWDDLHRRAFELANGNGGREVFELHRETDIVRNRYGMHPLGQNLLLARRLVEAGVGFVTVNGWTGNAPGETGGGPPASSWDMHGSEMGMGNAFGSGSYGMGWCLPCLDQGLSALLIDLRERGLLERTLVVVMGEFGRTPRINQPDRMPGRQHWPNCWSAILAGAGIRGGAVYGETDRIGAYVKDRPVRVQDLGATIYHALDVSPETRLGRDGFTRPITTGQPILELFG
ncbi:MAG: DUF1501 domain-containing protein [Gemmataceae bacterium]|nr:DUF1501 domain-containing protein [Gemmataceae bacterium]MCI0742058.1 DUF1501 domain-containing protein [Gemmataceae bacterium]